MFGNTPQSEQSSNVHRYVHQDRNGAVGHEYQGSLRASAVAPEDAEQGGQEISQGESRNRGHKVIQSGTAGNQHRVLPALTSEQVFQMIAIAIGVALFVIMTIGFAAMGAIGSQ